MTAEPHTAEFPRGRGPERLQDFSAALAAAGFAAAVVSHHRNVLYLSGTAQPCNLLVVPGSAPVLFSRRFGALARAETWVEEVIDAGGFGAVGEALAGAGVSGGRLGLELDVMPAALAASAAQRLPGFEVADCAPLLLAQRMRKDEAEIAAIEAAARLFRAAHAAIAAELRPGVREDQLAAAVVGALRGAGHAGIVFQRRWDGMGHPEVLASGPNLSQMSGGAMSVTGVGLSVAVPMGASRRPVAAGECVNIDVGVLLDGYHADIARTYVLGEPTPALVAAAGATRAIQDAAIEALVPGRAASAVYDVALATATEAGVADVFQGFGETRGPYIGHGIGLEIDEPPVLGPGDQTELAAGMVVAVEPKLISPQLGAVNIEDEVIVTPEGGEVIDVVPRTLFLVDGRGGIEPLPVSSP